MNLATLIELRKSATPGPYEFYMGPYLANVRSLSVAFCGDYVAYQSPGDAQYDACLRNAAEQLIEIAQAAQRLKDWYSGGPDSLGDLQQKLWAALAGR